MSLFFNFSVNAVDKNREIAENYIAELSNGNSFTGFRSGTIFRTDTLRIR